MVDMSYRCHHCGSVHEVESIRENLYVDRQPVGSYAGVIRHPLRDYRAMARWRLARGIAAALWPRYRRGTLPH